MAKTKGAIKFVFWTAVSVGLFYYAWFSYTSGQMISWYYYKSKSDGYAIHSGVVSKRQPRKIRRCCRSVNLIKLKVFRLCEVKKG